MCQRKIKIKTKEELETLGYYVYDSIRIDDNTSVNELMMELAGKIIDVDPNDTEDDLSGSYKYSADGWAWTDEMVELVLTKEENPEYFL